MPHIVTAYDVNTAVETPRQARELVGETVLRYGGTMEQWFDAYELPDGGGLIADLPGCRAIYMRAVTWAQVAQAIGVDVSDEDAGHFPQSLLAAYNVTATD